MREKNIFASRMDAYEPVEMDRLTKKRKISRIEQHLR